jgi:hypothetical protein
MDSSCDGGCTAGYYCPEGSSSALGGETGTRDTEPCTLTNKFCPANSKEPQHVDKGFYAYSDIDKGISTKNTDQRACTAGNYCDDAVQSACPSGYYQEDIQATTCSKCPAGRYGSSSGLITSACDGLCSQGHFCAAGSQSRTAANCTGEGELATMYYCPAGVSEPKQVGPGYYATERSLSAGFGSRALCEAGWYCVDGVKRKCEAGNYCEEESSSALPCRQPKSYCPDGATQQLTVDRGYYAVETDSGYYGAQKKCELGSSCVNGVMTPCFEGHFADELGSAACSKCPQGKYGAIEGLATANCSGLCDAGYVCPAGSTSSDQVRCTSGKYSHPGASRCASCQEGRYSVDAGTNATLWPVHSSCVRCPQGYNAPSTGATDCRLCNPGFYADIEGLAACKWCPGGRYGATRGLDTSNCTAKCEQKFYCTEGSTTVAPADASCSRGTFCPEGSSTLRIVKGGLYMNYTSYEMLMCKIGFSCLGGELIECGIAKYQDEVMQDRCKTCPPGKYGTDSGAAACIACAPGQYSLAETTSCILCEEGKYASVTGSESCPACNAGTVLAEVVLSCLACAVVPRAVLSFLRTTRPTRFTRQYSEALFACFHFFTWSAILIPAATLSTPRTIHRCEY